jgi:serine protease Do
VPLADSRDVREQDGAREADYHVDDAAETARRFERAAAEDGVDEVPAEQTDKAPVQGADGGENESDLADGSGSVSSFHVRLSCNSRATTRHSERDRTGVNSTPSRRSVPYHGRMFVLPGLTEVAPRGSWLRCAALPLALLCAACAPRLSRSELTHASRVLACPQVYPAKAAGSALIATSPNVQRIEGCGKALYFRKVCGHTGRACKLVGDDVAILEHAAATIPCQSAELRIEHLLPSSFRVQGCGVVREYAANSAGFAPVNPAAQPKTDAGPIVELGQRISRSRAPLGPAGIFARSYQSTVVVIAGERQATGFSISTDGLIATNLHVIAGAPEIRVRFVDGHEGIAKHVEAYDASLDLALLRINRNLHGLPLAPRDQLSIGEWIVTIGNPLGLQATISEGIVSGVRRDEKGQEFVQTTAAISPGSSGGPIFNQHGEVIAVSTFVLRGGANLGFGVPIKYVHDLIDRRRHIPLAQFAVETAEASPDGIAGCTGDDRLGIRTRTTTALEAGSDLEKSDRWLAARQLYEGAMLDIVSSVSTPCKGPRRGLTDARDEAAALASDRERARALRTALEKVRLLVAD